MPKIQSKPFLKGETTVTPKQMSLPTKHTEALHKIEQAKILVVGPPGWGKTEMSMANENSITLACEEGHAAVKGYKMIIDAWKGSDPWVDRLGIQHLSFVDAVSLLQKEKQRFDMVNLDTLDSLIKMLLEHTLGKKRVEHASDLGDYGKGYDIAQNTPFREQFNKLIKTGRGLFAITHEKVVDKSFAKGPVSKRETTLPRGIYDLIFTQCDMVIHGMFGKVRKPNKTRDRLAFSEGSENMLAKNRGGYLPPAWIVPRDISQRWKQLSEFFSSEKAREKAFKEFLDAGYDLE